MIEKENTEQFANWNAPETTVSNESDLWRTEAIRQSKEVEIRPEDRNEKGQLLGPDGTVSQLKESEWKLVRTNAFKEWFGDWQTQNADCSQIRNTNGEPFLVQHETNKEFDKFDDSKFGTTNDHGYYGTGHYFTTRINIPGYYSGEEQIVFSAFLNIRNPVYYDTENESTLYYRCLLNRKDKNKAIEDAKKYINIERERETLQELENGIIDKHRDIPQGVDFEEYWEKRRQKEINYYRRVIPEHQDAINNLPQLYDELNSRHDGVVVAREDEPLDDTSAEIVAYRSEQIFIVKKEDNRKSRKK